MKFTKAIVRIPAKSLLNGITTAREGKPDYNLALIQHETYIVALQKCGINVTALSPEESYPDSCFVEDTALLTEKCAIITRPGAKSRQGEETSITECLENFYETIEQIAPPATVDGGDIMMAGNHFYIGLSDRTNEQGAMQLAAILKKYGYSTSIIKVAKGLHLKSSMSYLENGNLLVIRKFFNTPELMSFNRIAVEEKENYAANCLWLNGKVLVPAGYDNTLAKMEKLGYETIVLDTSEFRKLDGGLSCLSLRF